MNLASIISIIVVVIVVIIIISVVLFLYNKKKSAVAIITAPGITTTTVTNSTTTTATDETTDGKAVPIINQAPPNVSSNNNQFLNNQAPPQGNIVQPLPNISSNNNNKVLDASLQNGMNLTGRNLKLTWNTNDNRRGIYTIEATNSNKQRIQQHGCFISPSTLARDGSLVVNLLKPCYNGKLAPQSYNYNAPIDATLVTFAPKNDKISGKVVGLSPGSNTKLIPGEKLINKS